MTFELAIVGRTQNGHPPMILGRLGDPGLLRQAGAAIIQETEKQAHTTRDRAVASGLFAQARYLRRMLNKCQGKCSDHQKETV